MIRKILTSLLILVFLASVTICGCGHEARAESPVANHHPHDHDHEGGPTFKHDCKKADVQLPQQVGISKPETKSGSYYDQSPIANVVALSNPLTENQEVRGPPPDWPDTRYTYPSIFLVTQRLLI